MTNSSCEMAPPHAKRPLENSSEGVEGGEEPPAKRTSNSADVIFRLVVSAGKIGKVIGKQGTQIGQLREKTGAHIKIANPVSFLEDRVILISSKEGEDESQSAAERALTLVANILLEDNGGENDGNAKTGNQNQASVNLIRLLIARSQAGCLIGKGGITINEIRESSGASIKILPPDQLPFCSSIGATDRLIQLSGKVSQVEKALQLITSKLRENPVRESLTVKPNLYFGSNPSLFPSGSLPGLNRDHNAAVPKIFTQISVPNALIGGVIGRGGVNITHIRAISGCSVKVLSPTEGTTERVITFEGAPEQISTAQSLVQAFLKAM